LLYQGTDHPVSRRGPLMIIKEPAGWPEGSNLPPMPGRTLLQYRARLTRHFMIRRPKPGGRHFSVRSRSGDLEKKVAEIDARLASHARNREQDATGSSRASAREQTSAYDEDGSPEYTTWKPPSHLVVSKKKAPRCAQGRVFKGKLRCALKVTPHNGGGVSQNGFTYLDRTGVESRVSRFPQAPLLGTLLHPSAGKAVPPLFK